MTVKKLIEELSQFDPDDTVWVSEVGMKHGRVNYVLDKVRQGMNKEKAQLANNVLDIDMRHTVIIESMSKKV